MAILKFTAKHLMISILATVAIIATGHAISYLIAYL